MDKNNKCKYRKNTIIIPMLIAFLLGNFIGSSVHTENSFEWMLLLMPMVQMFFAIVFAIALLKGFHLIAKGKKTEEAECFSRGISLTLYSFLGLMLCILFLIF